MLCPELIVFEEFLYQNKSSHLLSKCQYQAQIISALHRNARRLALLSSFCV